MADWILLQYNGLVDAFLDECSPDMYEHLLQRLDTLSENGSNCRAPVTKKLKGSDYLFELRSNKKDNKVARLLFYFKPGKKIVWVMTT